MVSYADRYKISALLREYHEIRSEVRAYEILQIVCIFLSFFSFSIFLIIAVLFDQPILIFISPAFPLFFILLAMGMLAYIINLELRASNIEGQLKKIIGEPTIQWEYTIGIFGRIGGNILNNRVMRYWVKISSLAIIVGISPVVISLTYGFNEFYRNFGDLVWILIAFYSVISGITIFIGYRFYTHDWEKLKLDV